MMAANIAPGMNRSFTAQKWTNLIPAELWKETVQEAEEMIDKDVQVDIQGYDIDPEVVKAARENAKRAGVDMLALGCRFEKDSLEIAERVEIKLPI